MERVRSPDEEEINISMPEMKASSLAITALALIASLVGAIELSVNLTIPTLECRYYGPYNASTYDLNYSLVITVEGNESSLASIETFDLLFVYNDSDPRTDLSLCTVVESDIIGGISAIAATGHAEFDSSNISIDDAFWIVIRNSNPVEENVTIQVIGFIDFVESPITWFMQNWIYFAAAAGALVLIIIGAVLIKCGCTKCGTCAQSLASKGVNMKSRV